ncbi:hypothetical protein Lal_00044676 [Lupinus albus]|nr:hypothetical protein Lal_00044676 [Lupinus albus]
MERTGGIQTQQTSHNGRRITCREYYSYTLQISLNDRSLLLRPGRLLQQYVVDNYVIIEAGRLRWICQNQNNIRFEMYQGLQDALHVGEYNAINVGQRTVLASSFIVSHQDLTQRYEDGMAIVLNDGKPDIFLTMTCNPPWSEITSELQEFQTPQDFPDLTTRIFRSKLEQLRVDVIDKGVLGTVKSYISEEYDAIVRAEIPYYEEEPQLHHVVLKHMVHGPCGILNPNAPCMKDGSCKKISLQNFQLKHGRVVTLIQNTKDEVTNQ